MKKTDKLFSAVVLMAAALCTSCSTDDLTAQQQGQGETKAVSLTATLGDMQTRAGMNKGSDDNTASFYWHNKDAILVQTKSSDGSYPSARFSTTDETGVTTATFWGDGLSSGATLGKYAVYPYNEKHQFTDEEKLTYNLPATYTYTTVDNGIFSKTADDVTTYRTNSTNIPMYGKISGGNVAFQYLGGVAVIRIDNMPYTSGTLTVTADQQLSGDFTVDLSADNPEIATASTETEADKTVTFTFSGATDGGVGVFYLPLATGEYTNLTIGISDSDGANAQTIPYGTLSVSCGNVQAISLTTCNGYLRNIRSIGNNHYMVNGREFVDLGLDVLWATMNVGASTAEEAGKYYAWSQTEAKNSYVTENYSDRYSTDGETLAAAYDAATVNWGAVFRTPTKSEMQELINQCTSVWDSEKHGYTVTSKATDNSSSIFLYAGGHGFSNHIDDAATTGQYMSSTCAGKTTSGTITLLHYGLHFTDSEFKMDTPVCWWGYPVRPVTAK